MRLPKFSNALFAMRGVWVALKEETQFQWILLLSVVLSGVAVLREASRIEFLLLVVLFVIVLCAEILNACFERLCDVVQPNYDTRIKNIKDLASAVTFILHVLSIAVWLTIIW